MKNHLSVPASSHHRSPHHASESGALFVASGVKRGNAHGFKGNWRAVSKRFGKNYRRYSLNLGDIPDSCFPAILSVQEGRDMLTLLARTDESTFRVTFSDGRESLVSQHYLEKIYDGTCALPLTHKSRSRRRLLSVFGQFSNLLADNPFKVAAAVMANMLTVLIVLSVMAGYDQTVPEGFSNRPLLIIGAGLTAGLLAYGVTGLRYVLSKVKWKDGTRKYLYPDFAESNIDAAVDLGVLPVFLALSLSSGGLAVTVPLLMGIAFVTSHFLRTRQLQSLLNFSHTWAAPLQWMIFLATFLSAWLISGNSGSALSGLMATLIIAAVSMERTAQTAGFARNLRLALMETEPEQKKEHFRINTEPETHPVGVQAENLFYTYPQSGKLGLFEVNFTIKPGERIGIFGREGSGKSTLCRILAGSICPEHGELRSRGKIGYLGSDCAIVYGTLRSNILLGHGARVPDYQIENMIRFVGLEELVDNNPLGLDLPVQERGASLSSLQCHLLCLARVLLHHPEILILDEPAGQLARGDAERFLQIINNYWQQRSQTRIVIYSQSSRTNLPLTTDRLLIMEDGRVIGTGSPGQHKKITELAHGSGQNNSTVLESAACHQPL